MTTPTASMKPMLAAAVTGERLTYPVLASPKLDGVRCVVLGGVVLSRSLKPIPNRHIQRVLGHPSYEGLDGELIVGPVNAADVFRTTSSAVMSIEGEPEFTFHVFDDMLHDGLFSARLSSARRRASRRVVKVVSHTLILDRDQLDEYESRMLAEGYEGVILRDPAGWYKHGRSTEREGLMLKLKRFIDAEAVIIGAEPLMHNSNEAELNELGQLRRSHRRGGLIARPELGALVVVDLVTRAQFKIGTGFDATTRASLWADYRSDLQSNISLARMTPDKLQASPGRLLGRLAKYKSLPVGVKDRPRHPVFLGLRDARDL